VYREFEGKLSLILYVGNGWRSAAALPPGNGILMPIGWEILWAPEPSGLVEKKKNLCFASDVDIILFV
jgi:hypothetical protein